MPAKRRSSSRTAPRNPANTISSIVLAVEADVLTTRKDDKKPPGPKYKAWQERYKKEIGKELRKKGFTPNEIEKILAEGADAIAGLPKLGKVYKFILKQLKRIYDAWDAITKARKTVGDPPPYDQ